MKTKGADRYSVIVTHINDLPEKIEHAAQLELKYLVLFDPYERTKCRLCVFFDDKGMENYLAKTWGDTVDRVREIIQQGIEGSERYVDTLDSIKDLLGFPLVNAEEES